MKKNKLRIPAIAMFCFIMGCYSWPKQSGTWEGEIGSILLYDAKNRACNCVTLQINGGPVLKENIPREVVLVKSNLETYSTNEFSEKKLRVTGRIASEFPICASTGEMLIGYRPNPYGRDLPAIYVLKVRK